MLSGFPRCSTTGEENLVEDRIAEQVASLRKLMDGILGRWMNYTFSYTEVNKEEMIQRMKEAWRKMIFKSPKRYDDERDE